MARTQYFRVIHPTRRDREPIKWELWPPRDATAYTFEQALGVLRALTQRWLDCRSWPPEELEPWAEPVKRQRKFALPPPGDPTPGSWTLRDYAQAHLELLATRAGCELTEWLTKPDLLSTLGELDAELARVFRHTMNIKVPDDD